MRKNYVYWDYGACLKVKELFSLLAHGLDLLISHMPYEVLDPIDGFALGSYKLSPSCYWQPPAELSLSLSSESKLVTSHWAVVTVRRCLPLLKLDAVIQLTNCSCLPSDVLDLGKYSAFWGAPQPHKPGHVATLAFIFMSWPYSLAWTVQRSAIFFLPNSISLTHLRYISLASKILSWHSFRLFSTCSAHTVGPFVGRGAFLSSSYVVCFHIGEDYSCSVGETVGVDTCVGSPPLSLLILTCPSETNQGPHSLEVSRSLIFLHYQSGSFLMFPLESKFKLMGEWMNISTLHGDGSKDLWVWYRIFYREPLYIHL